MDLTPKCVSILRDKWISFRFLCSEGVLEELPGEELLAGRVLSCRE